MFMLALVNGVWVNAMVDNEATHNFVATRESERLSLNLEEGTNIIKVVNNKTQKTHGNTKHVSLKIGSLEE